MIADCYDVFCQIVTELSAMKLDARIHWYQHQACKAYIGLLLSCMKRSHISDTNLLYTSAPSYVSVEGGRELKNLFQFDVDVYIKFCPPTHNLGEERVLSQTNFSSLRIDWPDPLCHEFLRLVPPFRFCVSKNVCTFLLALLQQFEPCDL